MGYVTVVCRQEAMVSSLVNE